MRIDRRTTTLEGGGKRRQGRNQGDDWEPERATAREWEVGTLERDCYVDTVKIVGKDLKLDTGFCQWLFTQDLLKCGHLSNNRPASLTDYPMAEPFSWGVISHVYHPLIL